VRIMRLAFALCPGPIGLVEMDGSNEEARELSTIDRSLRKRGRPFVIYRGDERVGEVTGLKDGKQRAILFRPYVEILVGDWLKDQRTQSRLVVTDVDHVGLSSSGRSSHIRVFYEPWLEYERQESATQVISMLDEIAEAVSKLSDKKMPPEKKRRAQAAVRELQELLKTLPPETVLRPPGA
jgi:hypothetical protein